MKKNIDFRKYHGTGNDFILLNALNSDIVFSKEKIMQICDRHFGVGADGILILLPSKVADYRMRILNSDGSEPEMCGNGIRCFVHYLYDLNLINNKKSITIETLGGIKEANYYIKDNSFLVEVNMGEAFFEDKFLFKKSYIQESISDDESFTAVSMGNPHMIIVKDKKISLEYLNKRGKELVYNKYYTNGTNVEFISLNNDNEVDMLVYERGAGMTLACGTGACASVSALKKLGKVDFNTWVKVHLLGGDLEILVKNDYKDVLLKGEAKFVFSGTIEI